MTQKTCRGGGKRDSGHGKNPFISRICHHKNSTQTAASQTGARGPIHSEARADPAVLTAKGQAQIQSGKAIDFNDKSRRG